ncbi:MAG: hypothetical protein HN764_05925 [Gammaproteobacteria bacterium]|jgi:hypothetical protein|nr:hypothetical protein [Gammaproteobacteria bacterium]
MFKSMFLLLLLSVVFSVAANDVKFTLLEKSKSYEMDESGKLKLLKNEFVSETILSKDGAIVEGILKRADNEETIFELIASDSFFNRYANSYADFVALDKAHPNTDYLINITGKTSTISDLKLSLNGPEGEVQVPDPIRISLVQEQNVVAVTEVDADKDLQLVWSSFSKGAVDPNGILNDLIFALVSDCHGNSVSRSGIPFIMPEYLTYEAEQHLVPAEKLQPGLGYIVIVIHVNGVDTAKTGETTAMATYNTSTKMRFQTRGENTGPECNNDNGSGK